MTVEDAAVDDDAGAHSGAHDDAEYHLGVGMVLTHRPKMGFRQREAVGIVGDKHRHAEPALQIFLERPAVELGGVAVFHQAGLRIPRPWRPHADEGRPLAELVGALCHQLGDLADHVVITAGTLGGNAMAQQHLVPVQYHALALGTAKVDTPIQQPVAHPASSHDRRAPAPECTLPCPPEVDRPLPGCSVTRAAVRMQPP